MIIKNLTPHTLNIIADGSSVNIPPATEGPARVSMVEYPSTPISGTDIPTVFKEAGEITGLPAPQPGTIYVVSGMVEAACPDRKDVYSPGELVRDEKGRPIGARGLSQSASKMVACTCGSGSPRESCPAGSAYCG